MATTTSITTNFKGVDSKEIFLEIFKKADTLAKRLITITAGILGSYYLPKLSYSPQMRLVTGCGWNPTGAVSLTEKEIVVKKFEIASEFCKEDFAKTFQAQNEGLFSATSEIPKTITSAILSMMVSAAGETIDNQIWQGTGTHSIAGLIPQFVADATVVKVSSPVAITPTNVSAELSRFDDLVIPELDGESDLVYVVSRNVAKAYKKAQNTMGINTTVGDKELDYMGTRLEVVNGMPNNFMIAYRIKNLHFATGVESDLDAVRITDSDAVNQDGRVLHSIKFLAAVGYVDGSEIVMYKG